MPRPLEGLRVVEISAFVAAPLAGATLASLGAEVVRIEPPRGGIDALRWPLHHGRSLYRAGLDQGKRSVAIDLRSPRGQELAADLIASAGAFLTNLPLAPWSSYERLAQTRPDLIMAVLTGDPDGGAAVDYTVNAAIGFPLVTGPEGATAPVDHVLPAWDIAAGHLAALGIVAAHARRLASGAGELIELSLFNVALAVSGHLGVLAEAQLVAEPRGRYGNHIFGTFGRDFRTRDGRHVMVVALTPRQWKSLVEATQLVAEMRELEARRGIDLTREADRFAARDEIAELIARWVAARDHDDVAAAFGAHDVLWGPFRTFQEFVRSDPRFAENAIVGELDVPGIGRYRAPGSPVVFGGEPRGPEMPPALGEHTADVLSSWLGVAPDRLATLRDEGVIA